MRFEASIFVPKVDGVEGFELAYQTDDELEAFQWLARAVTRHPDSEVYAIMDLRNKRIIHQAGIVEAELEASLS